MHAPAPDSSKQLHARLENNHVNPTCPQLAAGTGPLNPPCLFMTGAAASHLCAHCGRRTVCAHWASATPAARCCAAAVQSAACIPGPGNKHPEGGWYVCSAGPCRRLTADSGLILTLKKLLKVKRIKEKWHQICRTVKQRNGQNQIHRFDSFKDFSYLL